MAAPDLMEIAATAAAIANLEFLDAYEDRCVVPPPEEATLQAMPPHLSLTSVYMIPGRPTPRLHKAVHLPHPEIPRDIRETSVALCLEPLKTDSTDLTNNWARLMAGQIRDACDDMETHNGVRDTPFVTLGVAAVYLTEVGPFSYRFANRDLVATLSEHVTPTPSVADFPDEVLRRMHTMKAEHDPDIAAFEEWREAELALFATRDSDEERRHDSAMGMIGQLLLPRDYTHPVFNVQLF